MKSPPLSYHLVGARSFIAKALASRLKNEGFIVYEYSSAHKFNQNQLSNNLNEKSIVVYFSLIKDCISSSLCHLNQYLTCAIHAKSKFIYISSKNAETPSESYYSSLKFSCDNHVLINGGEVIRLGLVITNPPMGPHKSLLNLSQLPVRLRFSKKTVLVTSNMTAFLELDFTLLPRNQVFTLYSSEVNLNDFLEKSRMKPYIFTINLTPLIYLLKKINKVYKFRGIVGRILTLNAYQK